jgi:hypothetical protein
LVIKKNNGIITSFLQKEMLADGQESKETNLELIDGVESPLKREIPELDKYHIF